MEKEFLLVRAFLFLRSNVGFRVLKPLLGVKRHRIAQNINFRTLTECSLVKLPVIAAQQAWYSNSSQLTYPKN